MAVGEVYVGFVEDGGPLEGGGMLRLTSSTMTQLAIQRLPPTQLVLDLPTVTIRLVLHLKVIILLMNPIRRSLLPLADPRRRLPPRLILIHPYRAS